MLDASLSMCANEAISTIVFVDVSAIVSYPLRIAEE